MAHSATLSSHSSSFIFTNVQRGDLQPPHADVNRFCKPGYFWKQNRTLVRSSQRLHRQLPAKSISQVEAIASGHRKAWWAGVVPGVAAAAMLFGGILPALPADALVPLVMFRTTAAVPVIEGLAAAEGDLSAPAVAATPEERVAALKELLAQRKREKEAEAAAAAQAKAEAAAAAEAKQAPAVSKAASQVPTKSREAPAVVPPAAPTKSPSRSHGYMPLFLSQFLLLAAYGGAVTALLKVPASVWETAQKQVEAAAVKAVPLIDSALEQSKPFVAKAWVAGEAAAVEAKPYVEKAVEAAKPAVAKGLSLALASLQSGKEKLAESIAQAQAEAAAKKSTSPPSS
eukprot:TRINITY_DN481_c1_g1_i1.p1 TRINITY_DN481_c1_g1~~TRINITY_DN481_c1_g1_i1.p1  ORF type:complete len:343 (+),score=89.28 TRINITY_DN481_c1_g1_i1:93-1121(+)